MQTNVKTVPITDTPQLRIPLDLIIESTLKQVRGKKHRQPLDGLVQSIRANGVLQPVLVRPIKGGKFELICGERRWLASKQAGKKDIPAFVQDLNDNQARIAQLVENLQREDINELDEGEYYARMIEIDPSLTDAEIARQTGKTHDYVTRRLSLNRLIQPARDAFLAKEITLGHALEIAPIGPEMQGRALNEGCFEQEWTTRGQKPNKARPRTVRQLKEWIMRYTVMDLNKVPWDLNDSTLGLGACITCQYRTGTTPGLFADIADKNLCTNRIGFLQKKRQFIMRKADELRKKLGTDVLFVSTSYHPSDDTRKEFPPGTLTRSQYQPIDSKRKCEFAQPAILVDGSASDLLETKGSVKDLKDAFGSAIEVCFVKKCKDHMGAVGGQSPAPSSSRNNPKDLKEFRRRKEELFDIKVAERTRQKILGDALTKITYPLNRRWLNVVAVELLGRTPTKLVDIVNDVLGRGDDKELPDNFTGYGRDTSEALAMVEKMKDDELARLLVLLGIVAVDWNEYMARPVDQSSIMKIADDLKLNYALRDAETRVESCPSKRVRPVLEKYLAEVKVGKKPPKPSIIVDESAQKTLPKSIKKSAKKSTKKSPEKKPAKRASKKTSAKKTTKGKVKRATK